MQTEIAPILNRKFSGIFENELLNEMAEVGQHMELDAGEELISNGKVIRFIPLILSGTIKILRHDEEGNDLVLYFISAGESCAMSLNCCLGHKLSDITAIAEEDVKMIALPVQQMDDWLGRYRSWREFVFNTYQLRFDELMHALDQVAFHQLDERLLHYLEEIARKTGRKELQITHAQIARDLHSSREVISRLLKRMEGDGLLIQGRNRIELL